jgi:catechol 2,3-dioxygenase-like lactoylglutathione lyase family enzyme
MGGVGWASGPVRWVTMSRRVTFRPSADPDQVSHAMTLRVADCRAAYAALTARGAAFLTPPHDWGGEIRCFLRDPDGHLVEISESVPT